MSKQVKVKVLNNGVFYDNNRNAHHTLRDATVGQTYQAEFFTKAEREALGIDQAEDLVVFTDDVGDEVRTWIRSTHLEIIEG